MDRSEQLIVNGMQALKSRMSGRPSIIPISWVGRQKEAWQAIVGDLTEKGDALAVVWLAVVQAGCNAWKQDRNYDHLPDRPATRLRALAGLQSLAQYDALVAKANRWHAAHPVSARSPFLGAVGHDYEDAEPVVDFCPGFEGYAASAPGDRNWGVGEGGIIRRK